MAKQEDELWQRLLHEVLAVLALPPDEQVRVNGPGCVTCDLLENFDHAHTFAIGNALHLSEGQHILLDRINDAMRLMEPLDFECFKNDVLRRPLWQQLRALAAEALRAFGWERIKIEPFVEIQPGIFQRRVTDTTLGTTCGDNSAGT